MGGVCGCESDIWEYFPIHHSARICACLVVVGNSRMRFDLTDVDSEAFVVSYFTEVIGIAEEVCVEVVNISEGVEGVVAHCVYGEGTNRVDLEERWLFLHFDG